MRWFDLVRTGKLVERVKLYNKAGAPAIRDCHVLRYLRASIPDVDSYSVWSFCYWTRYQVGHGFIIETVVTSFWL